MTKIYLLYTESSEDGLFYGTPCLVKAYTNEDEADNAVENFNKKNKPYTRAYLKITDLV